MQMRTETMMTPDQIISYTKLAAQTTSKVDTTGNGRVRTLLDYAVLNYAAGFLVAITSNAADHIKPKPVFIGTSSAQVIAATVDLPIAQARFPIPVGKRERIIEGAWVTGLNNNAFCFASEGGEILAESMNLSPHGTSQVVEYTAPSDISGADDCKTGTQFNLVINSQFVDPHNDGI